MGWHSDKSCARSPCSPGRSVLALADKTKLRAHSDPLPGPGPFTLYRGVAGIGARRGHRGMSWTASFDCAAWFARCYSLPAPAVLRVEVEACRVLAYLTGRGEQEFVVDLPSGKRLAIQTRDRAEIEAAADRLAEKIRQEREDKLKRARRGRFYNGDLLPLLPAW
jgi:hypothetical protein